MPYVCLYVTKKHFKIVFYVISIEGTVYVSSFIIECILYAHNVLDIQFLLVLVQLCVRACKPVCMVLQCLQVSMKYTPFKLILFTQWW